MWGLGFEAPFGTTWTRQAWLGAFEGLTGLEGGTGLSAAWIIWGLSEN